MNKDNNGIPNSFIKVDRLNRTYPCDSKGGFSFTADISVEDTFIFYGQGYDKVKIVVDVLPEDSIIVELKKSSNRLQEVNIGARGGRVREEKSGSSKSIHNAGCYLTFKDEIAMFLPADSAKNGLLKDVKVYITNDAYIDDTKFLLHLYAPDSSGAPGEEVTDTLLVMHAGRGNRWVGVDMSNLKIQVKAGLFLSMEWTVGYGNDGLPWPMHGQTNYYAGNDSLRQFYNGQVLGLTWLNDVKPVVYRRYARTTFEKTAPDKWFLTPPLVGGAKRNECITPMMYYTYTYRER